MPLESRKSKLPVDHSPLRIRQFSVRSWNAGLPLYLIAAVALLSSKQPGFAQTSPNGTIDSEVLRRYNEAQKKELDGFIHLINDPDMKKRDKALFEIALRESGGVAALPVLMSSYHNDKRSRSYRLMDAIAHVGRKDYDTFTFLRDLVRDRKAPLPERISAALGLEHSDRGRSAITDLLKAAIELGPPNDPEGKMDAAMRALRESSLSSVAKLRPTKKDLPLLFDVHTILLDTDEELARSARRAIECTDPDQKDAIPSIWKIIDSLPDGESGDIRFELYADMLGRAGGADTRAIIDAHLKVSPSLAAKKRFEARLK